MWAWRPARRRSIAGLLEGALRNAALLDEGVPGLLAAGGKPPLDRLPRVQQPLLSLRHFASGGEPSEAEPAPSRKPKSKRAPTPRRERAPQRAQPAPSAERPAAARAAVQPEAGRSPAAAAAPSTAAGREPQGQPPREQPQKQPEQPQKQPEQARLSWQELTAEAERLRQEGSAWQMSESGQVALQRALKRFADSAAAQDKALALYVSATAFPRLAGCFRDALLASGLTPRLEAALLAVGRAERTDLLFGLFAEYVVRAHSKELQAYREAVQSMDLRKPYLWYPVARALKRRFIYHAGPTNSGKTFTALEALKAAPSGVYCGPLRLLAMEVFDSLNADGTFCNLITGQERKVVPGAQHTACTIEAISTSRRVDVAVIDEIQLLGDDQRGWAWTRALQGLPANEVHLCGDGSAIGLARTLARAMGEQLEVRTYSRFTPVEVEPDGLAEGWQDVGAGDCVVAFSRKAIYEIKSRIEQATGMRTCVVYGALPPETRRQQARLFNESGNGFDVMVASDAVGMGLNLNIRRIIFSTLAKFEGSGPKRISVSEMKQIAGRAGRRNSEWPVGYATCYDPEDVPALQAAMLVPQDELETRAAGLFPEFEHLEAYASRSLQADFQEVLARFAAEARLDGTYFFCRQEGMEMAAKLLARLDNLSLQEKYWFCMAPVNLREPRAAAALLHFAARYAAREPVGLDLALPAALPRTPDELGRLEQLHQVVGLWLWLSNRFGEERFPGRNAVEALSEQMTEQMHAALQEMYHEGAMPPPRSKRDVRETVQDMQTSFVQNLSVEARDHLREASAASVRAFLLRHAQRQQQRAERRRRRQLGGGQPGRLQRAAA